MSLSIISLKTSIIDVLREKLRFSKGVLWKIVSASAAIAAFPIPELSIAADLVLVHKEISFYISQLGLPEEGSERFAMVSDGTQKKVKALWATMASASHIGGLMAAHATEQAAEEVTCLIPFVGWLTARWHILV